MRVRQKRKKEALACLCFQIRSGIVYKSCGLSCFSTIEKQREQTCATSQYHSPLSSEVVSFEQPTSTLGISVACNYNYTTHFNTLSADDSTVDRRRFKTLPAYKVTLSGTCLWNLFSKAALHRQTLYIRHNGLPIFSKFESSGCYSSCRRTGYMLRRL